MEISRTERGARKLIRNGYVKHQELAKRTYDLGMRGEAQRKLQGRVKLDASDAFVEQLNDHTHVPSTTKCGITNVRANLKRKATTTQEPAQQILGAELTNVTAAAAVNLPNLSNLRRNIRHQRQQPVILPAPLRKEDVPVLPHQYQMTATGERFLV